jgi:RNA polymerase sigma-70 factor, ECF subfamily
MLLNRMQRGDQQAGEQAAQLVYGELRRIASGQLRREGHGQTLQTSDLVHDAYMRLMGTKDLEFQNRTHFYAIASRQMRRILVDRGRARRANRRGGGAFKVDLTEIQLGSDPQTIDILALDEALTELEKLDPRAAKIVELRYFGGYSEQETADSLGVALSTARRDYNFARSWLFDRIGGVSKGEPPR